MRQKYRIRLLTFGLNYRFWTYRISLASDQFASEYLDSLRTSWELTYRAQTVSEESFGWWNCARSTLEFTFCSFRVYPIYIGQKIKGRPVFLGKFYVRKLDIWRSLNSRIYFTSCSSVVRALVCQPSGPGLNPGGLVMSQLLSNSSPSRRTQELTLLSLGNNHNHNHNLTKTI